MFINLVPPIFRSAAYAKLENFEESLKDAETTVKLKPDWPKVSISADERSTFKIYLVYMYFLLILPLWQTGRAVLNVK